jgi:hypothetical protein
MVTKANPGYAASARGKYQKEDWIDHKSPINQKQNNDKFLEIRSVILRVSFSRRFVFCTLFIISRERSLKFTGYGWDGHANRGKLSVGVVRGS